MLLVSYGNMTFVFVQVSLAYDEYLKSFYPNQEENIFTNNNWTLSDELIELFQSNFFYKQHVRWDIQRFRPNDIITNEEDAENQIGAPPKQLSSSNNLEEKATNKNAGQASQEPIDHESEEELTVETWSTSVRPKRKVPLRENLPEHNTHSQPRKMKKN